MCRFSFGAGRRRFPEREYAGAGSDLDGEQDPWFRLWAFGTSPHGLGLAEEDFWMLTPREYYALLDVQQANTKLWAISQAAFFNAHFVTDGVPWNADDFLGAGSRDKRMAEKAESDRVVGRLVNNMKRKVRQTKPGDPEPADLPVWARRDFMPQPESRRARRARAVPANVGPVQEQLN